MINPFSQNTWGSSNAFAQAEILNLYDPDRGQNALYLNNKIDKEKALTQITELITSAKSHNGKGLAFIYEQTNSPTFYDLLNQLQKIYPEALIVEQDTTYSSNRINGLSAAAGQKVDIIYNFLKAETILAIDSDFLGLEGDTVKNARQFAENRRVLDTNSSMNRLYSVESNFSITGSNADHRFTLDSNLMGPFLVALAKELNVHSLSLPSELQNLPIKVNFNPTLKKWIAALAKDLSSKPGRSAVVVGDRQPPWVHALGLAINEILGALKTEVVKLVPNQSPDFVKNISDLTKTISHNSIQTLVIIGGNPVYSQPCDINFKQILNKVSNSIYLGFFPDETAQSCKYYLPQSHFLESWGDTIARDGSYSIRQPLIAPLFENCLNEYEFLSFLIDGKVHSDYELVKSTCENKIGKGANFEDKWRQYLSDGLVKDSKPLNAIFPHFNYNFILSFYNKFNPSFEPNTQKLNIDFTLDRTIYDGRYANILGCKSFLIKFIN